MQVTNLYSFMAIIRAFYWPISEFPRQITEAFDCYNIETVCCGSNDFGLAGQQEKMLPVETLD